MESGDSANVCPINVAKPTRHPFINFALHFRSQYKGEPKGAKEMAVLAGEAWRNLSDQEKMPYVVLANVERQKPRPTVALPVRKSTRLEKLRSQLNAMQAKYKGLQNIAKKLQSRQRTILKTKSVVPARRHMVRKQTTIKVARKDVRKAAHKNVRKAVRKPMRNTARKQTTRVPRRTTLISTSESDFSDTSF